MIKEKYLYGIWISTGVIGVLLMIFGSQDITKFLGLLNVCLSSWCIIDRKYG